VLPVDAVADVGVLGQGLEAVQEPGWDVEVPEALVVEQERLVVPERR